MFKVHTVGYLVFLFVLGVVGSASAQFSPDYYVTIADSEDPVDPPSIVNFDVTVGNQGDVPGYNPIILDIYLPMDVPVNWQLYLDSDEDTRTAIVDALFDSANILADDNIWNEDVSGIYIGDSFNNACEAMIIQPQDLVLTNGDSGVVSYEAPLPASGGVSGVAYIPVSGAQLVVNYGVGGCNSELFDDCAGIPCMGPRLTMMPTTGAPVEIIDDGDGVTNDGCQPFQMANPGYVALIDRGTCTFSDKAKNATDAGASGVIIANTAALGSVTPTGDSIMSMGCTDASCHSLITTIPAAFFSYNAGEELKAWMQLGPVTMYLGVRPDYPEYKQTKAYIWESASDPTDIDPDNNIFTETTNIGNGGGGGGGDCSVVLSPTTRMVDHEGGTDFIVYVSTQPGCEWTLDTVPSWVSITSPTTGTGYTPVSYDVDPNRWGARSGAITLENSSHSIVQDGVEDGGNLSCRLVSGPEDGSAEDALGWGLGDRFVQKFTPDTYPFSFGSACIAFTRAGADTDLDFDFVVFDDDGPLGSPGTLLASIPSQAVDIPYWLDFAFSGVYLGGLIPEIEHGSFYVGAIWNENDDRPFYIPADFSSDTPPQAAFFGTGDYASGWIPVEDAEPGFRSLFIHVADDEAFEGKWETIVGQVAPTPNGFGYPELRFVTVQFPMEDRRCVAVSQGSTYAPARIFCSSDLRSWTDSTYPINPSHAEYNVIVSAGHLDGSVVVGTRNGFWGAEIWRRTEVATWEEIADGGISGPGLNHSFSAFEEFNGHLYVGTENNDGTQVIRTTDGIAWETVLQGGLDSPTNTITSDLEVLKEELYLGVTTDSGDCSLWKTSDGVAWFKEVDDCFGTPGGSLLFAVYENSLYVGVTGTGEVHRTTEGLFWSTVFSEPGMTRIDSLIEYNDGLALAGGFESEPGSTVWVSATGDDWVPASFPGFGKTLNETVPSLSGSPYGLFAGTWNPSQGTELWLLPSSLFADDFESGDATGWSTVAGMVP